MIVKVDRWPTVLPNDDGIRPAGEPDRCFYCKSKVGELHDVECVCVMSKVRAEVLIHGTRIGIYEEYVPYFWEVHTMEFKWNESSWCSDNALDTIKWDSGEPPVEIQNLDPDENCSCSLLEFRFEETLDNGPFVEVREKTGE